MAGNLVSIMNASVSGRGGRSPEVSQKFKNMRFSIYGNHQNTRYRCSHCGVVIPGLTIRELRKRGNICPCCFTKDSIVTITKMEKAGSRNKFTREKTQELRDRIVAYYRDHKNVKLTELSEYLGIAYPNVVYHVKCLGLRKKDIRQK